jgi:hypothetical protein
MIHDWTSPSRELHMWMLGQRLLRKGMNCNSVPAPLHPFSEIPMMALARSACANMHEQSISPISCRVTSDMQTNWTAPGSISQLAEDRA